MSVLEEDILDNNLINKDCKYITVLFADIVQSSSIVATADPDDAEIIFNDVIKNQIKTVEKYKGTVNQVMGDGIMCLFGAEAPFEDHALRALLAGEEMLRDIVCVQDKYKNIKLKIRVAVNTGNVVLNEQNSDFYRLRFQATGETVHMTDKILKQAKPNQMIVSEHTKGFVDRYYNLKKIKTLKWNKYSPEVDIFSPIGLKDQTAVLSDKEYIARVNVEDRIRFLIEKEERRVLWLFGDPGIGKTSLVNNFFSKYANNNFSKILKVSFYPNPIERKSSFASTVLSELLLIKDEISADKILDELSRDNFEAPNYFVDCLKDILGQEGQSNDYLSLDASNRKRLCLDAFVSIVLFKVSNKNKLSLIIEDMHWADEDSILYIDRLLERYDNTCSNLIIMMTSRKEPLFDKNMVENKISKIFIDNMSMQEGAELIGLMDSKKLLSARMQKRVYSLSSGNPYFLKEYIAWINDLVNKKKNSKKISDYLNDSAPYKVSDIIYSKLVSMDKRDICVAKLASVIGFKVNLNVLQKISGIDRNDLLDIMHRLEDADILHINQVFPNPEWVFTHELLQKVIYNSIPKSARVEYHMNIINQLKLNEFRDIPLRYGIMAFHANKSGNDLYKYVYNKKAAYMAYFSSLYKSCIEYVDMACKSLVNVKNDDNYNKHRIKLLIIKIDSLFFLGKYKQAIDKVDCLLADKELLLKCGCLERVLSFKEFYVSICNDLEGAVKISKEILSINIDGKKDIYVRENIRLGSLYGNLGLYDKAIEHNLNIVNIPASYKNECETCMAIRPITAALSMLASYYAEIGDIDNSIKYFNNSYELLDGSKNIFAKIYGFTYLGTSLIIRDDYKSALVLLEKVYEYCNGTEAALLLPNVLSAYGISLAKSGKIKEGIKYCKGAISLANDNGLYFDISRFKMWYAEAMMLNNDYDMAIKELKDAEKIAISSKEEGCLAYIYYFLGLCYINKHTSNNSAKNSAHSYFKKALKITNKNSMNTLNAKVLRVLENKFICEKENVFS